MKKEKHPVYWLVIAVLVLLLTLGIALLVMGLAQSPGRLYASPAVAL